MTDKTIDENIDEIFREENPTAEAVKSLLNVEDKNGKSVVETRTDLDKDEHTIHSNLQVFGKIMKSSVLLNLIETRERKALSKERKSRMEIVAVARQPDMFMGQPQQQESRGLFKKLFSRKQIPPNY